MKKIEFVDLHAQYLSIQKDIDEAITRVIRESAYIKGKYLEQFEAAFAAFTEMPFCVGCANGTDTLEIALRALGVEDGDEVIVPANTWISTAEAVTTAGGTVVFVDNHPTKYTIDVSKIEEKINKNTKVIIPVHLYGLPAEMDKIMQLAQKYKLKVIEDCAQAHGARFQGKQVGWFGDTASYSFFPGKNLGAYGDAGGLTMRDESFRTMCRMIGDHGRLGKHDHGLEGRNSRLDGLQASILLAKLPYLSSWIERRKSRAKKYNELLKTSGIQIPEIPDESEHVFHLYVVQVDNREKVQEFMLEHGIPTGIHYPTALPFTTAYRYKGHVKEDFPVAFKGMSRIMSLPIYPELSDDQIEFICEKLVTAVRKFN
jgi:dTDP-4-amino-4,6-dideoxygalactose transaminase